MNPQSQQTVQIVGEIHIVLLPNGKVAIAKANIPGEPRQTLLTMIEEGKHQLLDQLTKKKAEGPASGIVVAPPGFRLAN